MKKRNPLKGLAAHERKTSSYKLHKINPIERKVESKPSKEKKIRKKPAEKERNNTGGFNLSKLKRDFMKSRSEKKD